MDLNTTAIVAVVVLWFVLIAIIVDAIITYRRVAH